MSEAPVLGQAAGYGIVVGLGLGFSVAMVGITWVQARYASSSPKNAEEFNSASHSVKPGLIACGIVSAWSWAATLLQSSAITYKMGISGSWWYASGACVQVLLFGMLACKLKLNAPGAATYIEIIGCRWGTVAHLTFLVFGLIANIVVSTMLVLGGSATVASLTGMSTVAACWLIPLTVAVYVSVGGMRASLFADYSHTVVLYALILLFALTAYATSDQIGSPSRMYALLEQAAARHPVEGNAGGSYLTMRSLGGGIFGVLNIIGNFGTVFADQAYWQRAIASTPQTAVKAYLIGGLCWFCIPFCLATCLGLGARALDVTITAAEVSAGLPAPKAAAALLGSSGAVAMLLMLFLAVTSATSAELVAAAAVLSNDCYKRYANPKATDQQMLRASQASVVIFAVVAAISGTVFWKIGLSMGYLYELMGCLIGSCVVPIAGATCWSKANKWASIGGAIGGLVAGVTAWLVTASSLYGEVTIASTGRDFSMLAGNVTAIGVGALVTVVGSLIWPEHYDFEGTRNLNAEHTITSITREPETPVTPDLDEKDKDLGQEKEALPPSLTVPRGVDDLAVEQPEIDFVGLNKAFRFAAASSLGLFAVLVLLIPMPLVGSGHIFGVKGFTIWVAVSIAWCMAAGLIITGLPLWESRKALGDIFRGMYRDLCRKRA